MPTSSAVWALQDAIATLLAADSELMGEVVAVYSHLPDNVAHPYVLVNNENIEVWSRLGVNGVEIALEIEAVTKDRTPETILTVIARLKALLHGASPSLSTGTLRHLQFLAGDMRRNTDNVGYNAGIRFRALVDEA